MSKLSVAKKATASPVPAFVAVTAAVIKLTHLIQHSTSRVIDSAGVGAAAAAAAAPVAADQHQPSTMLMHGSAA